MKTLYKYINLHYALVIIENKQLYGGQQQPLHHTSGDGESNWNAKHVKYTDFRILQYKQEVPDE